MNNTQSTILQESAELFKLFTAKEAEAILYMQLSAAASTEELDTEERAAAFMLHKKLTLLLMALEQECQP